jgi:hypothetical protein
MMQVSVTDRGFEIYGQYPRYSARIYAMTPLERAMYCAGWSLWVDKETQQTIRWSHTNWQPDKTRQWLRALPCPVWVDRLLENQNRKEQHNE